MASKSIRIYLADGTPTGLRHAEIVNWTGQALAIPRKRISELKEWTEINRPGVYFLFGETEQSEKPVVYIGESENVHHRLIQHIRSKDFWNLAIVFTSKDENLTKSHIRYLEARSIEEARLARRYELANGSNTQLSSLPRADRDSMEEFFQNLKVLLGTLGHRVLESLIKIKVVEQEENSTDNFSEILKFESSSFLAMGFQTDEGFIILKGSTISHDVSSSITPTLSNFREDAKKNGELKRQGDKVILVEDILFSSPSYAASFAAGNSRNGRISWKNNDGLTLRDLEEQALVEQEVIES